METCLAKLILKYLLYDNVNDVLSADSSYMELPWIVPSQYWEQGI